MALAFVLVLGAFAWAMPQPGETEPIYQGKPLSYWLQGYLPSRTFPRASNANPWPTRAEATAAVQHLGTNAIPTLLHLLSTRDFPLATRLMQMAQRQHFIHISYTSSWECANEASSGLTDLADNWGLEVPQLVPQLMQLFEKHPNTVSRQVVPVLLGRIGPPAKAAVPMLLRATTDPDDYVRNNAVYALGQIHAQPALTVPALIKSLDDSADFTRMNAARALASFSQDARPAVPALLRLLAREQTNSVTNSGAIQNFNSIWGPSVNSPRKFWPNIDVLGPTTEALRTIDPDAAAQAGIK
jgi:hypothetical protein